MQIWEVLLGSLTELELLRIGEALGIQQSSAIGVLKELLRDPRHRHPRLLVPHLSDDTARTVVSRVGLRLSQGAAARELLAQHLEDGTDWVTVETPRRRPRLAWQGRSTEPGVSAVPMQVVEVVVPGLDTRRANAQVGLGGFLDPRVRGQREAVNRLIWTSDNLVALQTLVDERDPLTQDPRYRGRVDLIYIDPPFMVSNDFVADNSIEIEVDDQVSATKEPSVVELLAYKDTWREGLDSFLSMLRARLVLLRELLAPTGSIYVHLDWHAAHYVKVLMDEIFGYENFQSEIVWKRTSARADTIGFNQIHDVILSYRGGEATYFSPVMVPHSTAYIVDKYNNIDPTNNRRYRLDNMTSPNPRPNMTYEWKGYKPPPNGWRYSRESMEELDRAGLVVYPENGSRLYLKRYLDEEGQPLQSIWDDIPPVNSQAAERLGYPTQKPLALLERIIRASCPPNGLVLDAFMGSGTSVEAAERLGRRWIGIDNGKYAVHLARKRLIQLHQQPKPPEQEAHDYVECERCKNIERRPRRGRSPGPYAVRPFSVENAGVYLRGHDWLDALGDASAWRPEMVRVFGGEPTAIHPLLHGRKEGAWVHVGPLDMPLGPHHAWQVARAAADTELRAVELLSADYDPVSQRERDDILRVTGVRVTVRVIPQAAIDQLRLRLQHKAQDGARESMAVPAFYTPLAIHLRASVDGPQVTLTLASCEVDVQSFIASQRPALKSPTNASSDATRRKIQAELQRWEQRRAELTTWLAQANTWQHFVDFWAVDWDYADSADPGGRAVFNTEWQSFTTRQGKKGRTPPTFQASARYERPGQYRIAARVVDVFGNDGIAVVDAQVGQ